MSSLETFPSLFSILFSILNLTKSSESAYYFSIANDLACCGFNRFFLAPQSVLYPFTYFYTLEMGKGTKYSKISLY